MTRTYTCPCGHSRTADGGNVGEISRATGMTPLFMHDGNMLWLCESCTIEAAVLVGKLMNVLGHPKYMAMISLTKMWERCVKSVAESIDKKAAEKEES